ncbi:hypothetical protein CO2235_U1080003 [Cupriavidus oxalaticus]|uniref:Uncharacterized protein n=1 Tax=Cupriavidus oxalaticus TaxID=96344 RepID=A0A375FLJ1_9BURK|nr:hypothetical protein CO2235_U1080003 [Cupriavidus oxalaticus]
MMLAVRPSYGDDPGCLAGQRGQVPDRIQGSCRCRGLLLRCARFCKQILRQDVRQALATATKEQTEVYEPIFRDRPVPGDATHADIGQAHIVSSCFLQGSCRTIVTLGEAPNP